MAKKKKPEQPKQPEYPIVIETFRDVGKWEIRNWRDDTPSAFNGIVRYKKYRVTIEEIEEPIETYQERLEKMWVECDNWHHWSPLKAAAESIGYTFKGEHGSQKPKKQ